MRLAKLKQKSDSNLPIVIMFQHFKSMKNVYGHLWNIYIEILGIEVFFIASLYGVACSFVVQAKIFYCNVCCFSCSSHLFCDTHNRVWSFFFYLSCKHYHWLTMSILFGQTHWKFIPVFLYFLSLPRAALICYLESGLDATAAID